MGLGKRVRLPEVQAVAPRPLRGEVLTNWGSLRLGPIRKSRLVQGASLSR